MKVFSNFQFGNEYKKLAKKNTEATRNSIQDQLNSLLDPEEQSAKGSELEQKKAVVTDISEEMQEKSKQFKISMIVEKMKAGAKLSGKEEKYLAEHSPSAYKMAMEIKKERQAMEEELKSCKSKKQVEGLMQRKNSMFMSSLKVAIKTNNRSEVERLTTVHNNVKDEHKLFTKTMEYENLPERSDDDDNKIDYGKKKEKISKEELVDLVKKQYTEKTDEVGREEAMLDTIESLFIDEVSESASPELTSESLDMANLSENMDLSFVEDIPIIVN